MIEGLVLRSRSQRENCARSVISVHFRGSSDVVPKELHLTYVKASGVTAGCREAQTTRQFAVSPCIAMIFRITVADIGF